MQAERSRTQDVMHSIQMANIGVHKHTVTVMSANANPARTVPAGHGTATTSGPRTANEILQEHDADLTVGLLVAFPSKVDGVLAGIQTTGAQLVVMAALKEAGCIWTATPN